MKFTIVLLCTIVCFTHLVNAQKDRAVLIFKDGTQLEGLADLKSSDKIRFRKEKRTEKQFYTFDEVDTLKVYEDFDPIVYVQVRVKDKEEPKVLELANQGKNLVYYRDILQGYMAPAMMPGGGMPMTVGRFYSLTNSYVRRPGEDEATYLGSSSWLSKNFKKAASDYFADCPHLVSKIQNRELKKKHLKEIIAYYNTKCE